MEIRLAQEKDLSQIMKLKDIKNPSLILGRMEKSQQGTAAYLIAEENEEIIGHILLKFYGKETAPDYPDIEDAFVKDELRGKSIGTKLIKEVEEIAKEKKFNRIGLAVDPTLNPKAKSLYERLGYKEVGNPSYLDGIYNGTEVWVVDMAKDLK